jgi:primosomal protein N' (replication factor Y) (superfamily II helicase)
LIASVRPGALVTVPLQSRRMQAVALTGPRAPAPADPTKLRPIEGVADGAPPVSATGLKLGQWVADYYMAPVGLTFRALVPSGIGQGDKLVVALTALGRARKTLLGVASGGTLGERVLAAFADDEKAVPVTTLERRLGVKELGPVVAALVAAGEVMTERLLAADKPKRTRKTKSVTGEAGHDLPDADRALTAGQAAALDEIGVAIAAAINTPGAAPAQPFLLHGVTGSGKTEVYLRAADQVLAQRQGVLMLVPEIVLTARLIELSVHRFGERVAVLHSGLTPAQRLAQWKSVRAGEKPVVIGPRSAVFAPLDNVGLVVVDEEHDPAWKQEEAPRYNGRDVALVRARLEGAVCVLGSATPSAESWEHSETNKYRRLVLPHRVHARPLPQVTVVDAKLEGFTAEAPLTAPLADALAETLAKGEQAIILHNRRGYAPSLECTACGHSFDCPQCGVALVVHRQAGRLDCHYCGYTERLPHQCPVCSAPKLETDGLGIEQLEAIVAARYPTSRVVRLDRDTAQIAGHTAAVLGAMRRREADILIGTQMVAKGHDFPDVTLVGVVMADIGLHMPDFRAAERTYQLLTQVAGRAGRGLLPGRVIIQTRQPEHDAVRAAASGDYEAFIRAEIEGRGLWHYPPAGRLMLLRGDAQYERDIAPVMDEVHDRLRAALVQAGVAETVVVMPACPAPMPRLRDRVRYQLILKLLPGASPASVRAVLRQVLAPLARTHPAAHLVVDVDPQVMV